MEDIDEMDIIRHRESTGVFPAAAATSFVKHPPLSPLNRFISIILRDYLMGKILLPDEGIAVYEEMRSDGTDACRLSK